MRPSCSCGKHALHQLYSFYWKYPGLYRTRGGLTRAAKELHVNYGTLKKTAFRLRRLPDVSRRCPLCFEPELEGLACRNCGVELDAPTLPDGIRFEETSPVHTIQPLKGLGSLTDYRHLHLEYGAQNVKHIAERPDDAFVESCRSELWGHLKGVMPPDSVTEEANRLLMKEIIEFRSKYPGLVRAKGVRSQIVTNVVGRLALRYPALRVNGGMVA
jgi:hypothetical protein